MHCKTGWWKVAWVLLKHGADASALAEDGLIQFDGHQTGDMWSLLASFESTLLAKATTPDELG